MDSKPTLLRIKRKRYEEPLDTLLVQEQLQRQRLDKRIRKNSLGQDQMTHAPQIPKVFRFAETVEEKSFANESEALKLRDRINKWSSTPVTTQSTTDAQGPTKPVNQTRYRVIHEQRPNPNMPPVVQSSAEKAVKDMFQMFDAVKDESSNAKLLMDEDDEEADDIMCNFIPMVKEYLSLNDSMDEDYVYDVYYCDVTNNPASFAGANIASLVWFDDQNEEYMNDDSDSELGDFADEDSNAEDFYQNDYPDEVSDEDFEEQFEDGGSSDNFDEEYDFYYS
ncbi:hypothetical protein DM01DRAFT_1333725 [Hesseltinella vesiculosa]|uniref:Probable RNA polymerase II nuclear localization protein SLC7A6OS n=1 Tax=Hesseltinella vesiculosa TaxID=101127 RepID=A0A1X2GNP2_9FUNG|nr:hypothetical protein DM01DRAFT_1333725 [Hesseltinella vesiculosa]